MAARNLLLAILFLLLPAAAFGQGAVLQSGSVVNNHCVKWIGNGIVGDAGANCGTTGGSGTVTSIATGTGLTGGPITTTGTISLATIATARVLGNVSGITAVPTALTGTQLTTLLDPFSSSLQGAVPASGGGASNFLRADGSWASPGGGVTSFNTRTGAITLTSADITGATGVLVTGTPVTGHCVAWASATVAQDAGAACGSGGSGGDVNGPGASTARDVVFWNNTLGTLVSDPGTMKSDASGNISTTKALTANTLGSMPLAVTPYTAAAAVNTSFNAIATTASATLPEWTGVFSLKSNTGTGNTGNDKVALFAAAEGASGTANIWALNTVTLMDAASGDYFAQGYELDFVNNNVTRGDTAGIAGLSGNLAVGQAIAVAGGNTINSTGALWIASKNAAWGTGVANRGIFFTGTYGLALIEADAIAPWGIDLTSGTTAGFLTVGAIHLPNTSGGGHGEIWINDATGTPRSALYMDGSNFLTFGGTGVTDIVMANHVIPITTNTYTLGIALGRWSTIYGTNGDFATGILIGANSVPAVSGAVTNGHCVQFASATTISDAGAACGSGSGGITGPGTTTVGDYVIWNSTTGAVVKDSAIKYTTAIALDISGGTFTTAGILLPNQSGTNGGLVAARNAANNANVTLMYLDGSNNEVLGGSGVSAIISAGVLAPVLDSTYALGTNILRWAGVWSTTGNFNGLITSSAGATLTGSVGVTINTSSAYGIDFVGGSNSSSSIRLRNGTTGGIIARNAAANADLNVIYLDSSNNLTLATGTAGLFTQASLQPGANNTYTSGGSSLRWSGVYGVLGNFSGAVTGNNFVGTGSSTYGIDLSAGTWATGSIALADNKPIYNSSGGIQIINYNLGSDTINLGTNAAPVTNAVIYATNPQFPKIANSVGTATACLTTASGSAMTYQASNTCVPSAGRLKNVEGKLRPAAGFASIRAELSALKPVDYHYKPDSGMDPTREWGGLVADDVLKIDPRFATRDSQGRPQSVLYDFLSVLTIAAIKEMETEIANLNREIQQLKRAAR